VMVDANCFKTDTIVPISDPTVVGGGAVNFDRDFEKVTGDRTGD
jgi:hypothetical protein